MWEKHSEYEQRIDKVSGRQTNAGRAGAGFTATNAGHTHNYTNNEKQKNTVY